MYNLLIKDHILIKKRQVYSITRLDSKELYKLQIILRCKKPTSQSYFENYFKTDDFDWKKIYVIPCIVTIDTKQRALQSLELYSKQNALSFWYYQEFNVLLL